MKKRDGPHGDSPEAKTPCLDHVAPGSAAAASSVLPGLPPFPGSGSAPGNVDASVVATLQQMIILQQSQIDQSHY